MKSVFFYGLFMDEDLLKSKGLHPANNRLARVDGYGLRIGDKATLEASEHERVFGSVMELGMEEVEILYGENAVADYVARQVVAIDMQGNSQQVSSYVLPMEKICASNSEYARSLAIVARKIGLPHDYIDEIETWIAEYPE